MRQLVRKILAINAVSEEHSQHIIQQRLRSIVIQLTRFGILITLLVAWEMLAEFKIIDPFIFSSPSRMWSTLQNQIAKGNLWPHVFTTTKEAVIGFIGGTLGGLLVAISLWWSDFVSKVVEPYLIILNAFPKIALGPVFIVWFGTGTSAIIAMALAISLITTIIMVYNGFKNIDSDKIKLAKTLGASKWQILWKVVIPASFPTVIAALKVNVGLSWVGVIVGEFLVSKSGLGYLAIYGGQVLNFSLVLMSTLLIVFEAALMYGIVASFEYWYLRKID